MRPAILLVILFPLASLFAVARGQGTPERGGRISQLKVLSDKVDDVTTIENIVKSFAKPGMSDQKRAEALWRAVVKYRYQTAPPNEHLAGDWEAHDPVKIFNVYGYCMCCCCSALLEALNREDGREARGRILRNDACWWKGGTGLMTVPIDVPGDLFSLGFSAQIRRGVKRT